MAEMNFRFSGRKTDVEATLLELNQRPEVASVSSKEVLQTPSILRQGPHRRFELCDTLLHGSAGLSVLGG